jgi:hypothetical protein
MKQIHILKMEIIYSLIIILILGLSLFISFKHHIGSSNASVMKGYGNEKESTEILLDRIQWSNHYPARLNITARYAFFSVFISFLTSVIYGNGSAQNILQSIIVVWMILMGSYYFCLHHSDKFNSYFIDDNVSMIRKKLNLESNIEGLIVNQTKFSGNDDCFTFVY